MLSVLQQRHALPLFPAVGTHWDWELNSCSSCLLAASSREVFICSMHGAGGACSTPPEPHSALSTQSIDSSCCCWTIRCQRFPWAKVRARSMLSRATGGPEHCTGGMAYVAQSCMSVRHSRQAVLLGDVSTLLSGHCRGVALATL